MTPETLSHGEARRVYDRIGRLIDTPALCEYVATRDLADHGQFDSAERVFEFGCGTGRFAKHLLRRRLGPRVTYRAVDLSPRMVALARSRLSAFGDRVEIILSDGHAPSWEPSGSYDRFVSTFVFDLLSESDIAGVLIEAHRMLRPGGLLCLAGLSTACGPMSRASMSVWSFLHKRSPRIVGGCRSIQLTPFVEEDRWRMVHRRHLAPAGIPFEVVIAERTALAQQSAAADSA